jgi:8-oxo-dGTP pyrophosphatase MutT (NUDIX family)
MILTRSGLEELYIDKSSNPLVARYNGKTKHLFQYIDLLEKPGKHQQVILHSDDPERLQKDMKSLFQIIKAAGGLVVNELGEVLFIHRRGYWDLPKGKRDPGEAKKKTAIREVMEETGIDKLSLGKKLTRTRHVYRNSKGVRMLKLTDWYLMHSAKQPLTPQLSEDIHIAEWLHPVQFIKRSPKMYTNIKDVLKAYFDYSIKKI